MTRVGRSLTILNNVGGMAPANKTATSLAEVERWIGEHIKLAAERKALRPH
jgi:hypothetical protein